MAFETSAHIAALLTERDADTRRAALEEAAKVCEEFASVAKEQQHENDLFGRGDAAAHAGTRAQTARALRDRIRALAAEGK
jgi:hypothetical protein